MDNRDSFYIDGKWTAPAGDGLIEVRASDAVTATYVQLYTDASIGTGFEPSGIV